MGRFTRVFENDDDSVYAFAYGDINGDQNSDWIISNANGLNFRTEDNVSLFKYNSSEPFISLVYSVLGEKVFVSSFYRTKVVLV